MRKISIFEIIFPKKNAYCGPIVYQSAKLYHTDIKKSTPAIDEKFLFFELILLSEIKYPIAFEFYLTAANKATIMVIRGEI